LHASSQVALTAAATHPVLAGAVVGAVVVVGGTTAQSLLPQQHSPGSEDDVVHDDIEATATQALVLGLTEGPAVDDMVMLEQLAAPTSPLT
jgi:hypothetical protein